MSVKNESRPEWTAEEDDALRQYFASEGLDGLVKRLPDRTRNAIRKRGNRLRANPKMPKIWTKDEDEILNRHYAHEGALYVARHLKRTKGAIHNRANALGIKGSHDHCTKARHNRYTGYREITGSYWYKLRNNAAQRGLDFSITIEWSWQLYERQGRRCKLSGIPLIFASSTYVTDGNASLDRVDSSKGYIEENVQWVHKDINKMKWELSNGEFVQLCRQVAQEHMPKPLGYQGPLHLST